MIAPPPARCPGCGTRVKLTLVADPGTPVYQCGSTPYRVVCIAPMPDDRNLAGLSYDDRLTLGDLIAEYLRSRAAEPVVSLCTYTITRAATGTEYRCNATAVDGRCLIHG